MGKKTTKTHSESQPWAPAQPILTGAGQGILDTYNKNQPNLDALSAQLTGMIPKLSDTSMLKPGSSYLNSVLGGKYLTGNPYLDKMIASTANDVGNRVNSTFSMAGRTGSYNNVEGLAEGLGNAENGLRYQGYSDERQLQNNAAAMLPGYQQAKNGANTAALAGTQLAGQLPYYGANSLSGIGSLYGGYGTQTGTQPGGWGNTLGGILGAGLGGWASGGFKI